MHYKRSANCYSCEAAPKERSSVTLYKLSMKYLDHAKPDTIIMNTNTLVNTKPSFLPSVYCFNQIDVPTGFIHVGVCIRLFILTWLRCHGKKLMHTHLDGAIIIPQAAYVIYSISHFLDK